MRKIFAIACIIGAIAYWLTLILGLIIALKAKTAVGYTFSGVGSILIISLMFCTRDIVERKDLFHRAARAFWAIALIAGMYVAYLAAKNQIILEKSLSELTNNEENGIKNRDTIQVIAVILATLYMAASPVAISWMRKPIVWMFEDDEADETSLKSHQD